MPATRRLFRQQGVEYKHAFVTTPLCCPSRSSIMTGRYAHNHGVESNAPYPDRNVSDVTALDMDTTIQHYLDKGGYKTAIFGKFLNRWPLERPPPDFDRWVVSSDRYRTQRYNLGSKSSHPKGRVRTISRYNTTFLGAKTVHFVTNSVGKPWFVYLALSAPHGPFVPQHKYRHDTFHRWPGNPATHEKDLSDKPGYVRGSDRTLKEGRHKRTQQFRTLESVDDQVQAIFEALRETGQARNTLAFFLSDNGFLWGEHHLLHKNAPYPQDVEVPFLARWPRHLPTGSVDWRRAANIDITPTILEATNTAVPPEAPPRDGRSLLHRWSRRSGTFSEHWCSSRGECNFWASWTTPRLQYIEYYRGSNLQRAKVKFREYYNLRRDPWELTNLLHDGRRGNNPKIRPLHRQLRQAAGCEGAACP